MEFRLSAVVTKGEKYFVARGIEIELASQGKTVEESLKNLQEAFELWLKHADEDELAPLKKKDGPIVAQVAVAA